VPAVVGSIAEPVSLAPFDVAFGGIGVFPPRGAPNVLWVGVASGAREAADLQHQIVERVRPLGIPLESRPFHPHLTLARWRTSRPSDRRRVVDGEGEKRTIARVHVDHASLYHSRLSPAGSTYTVLARANLSAGLP
jgi:2'-5' RNA ligase